MTTHQRERCLPAGGSASVLAATPAAGAAGPGPPPLRLGLDAASRTWLCDLRGAGQVREAALARLHALLLRAARFEIARRRRMLPHLRGDAFEDIATETADDAMMAVLAHLDDF